MKVVLVAALVHILLVAVSAKKGRMDQDGSPKTKTGKKCDKTTCNQARSSLNFDKKCLKAQFCMKGVVKDAKKLRQEKEECLKERRQSIGSGEAEDEKKNVERGVIKNHQINHRNLQTRYDELKKNYDSIIGNQQKLEISVGSYKASNEQLKLLKEKADKENEELKISINTYKASNEELKSLKEATDEENSKLKKEMEDLLSSTKRMKVSEDELNQVKSQNLQLNKENEDLRKQNNDIKEKMKMEALKKEQPDAAVEELKLKNAELTRSVSELSDRNYKLTEKITETINNLAEVNLSLEKQLKKYEILKNETIKIGRKYKQLEVEYKQLEQEFNEKTKNNTVLVGEQSLKILKLSAQVTSKDDQNKILNATIEECASDLSFCRDETVKTSARLAKIVENKQMEAKSRKDEVSPANETCQHNEEKLTNLTIQLENCQQEFIEKDIALKKETQNFYKICREQHPELEKEGSDSQEFFREKESEVLSLEVKNQILSNEIKNLTDSLSECKDTKTSIKPQLINLQEFPIEE